MVCVMLKFCYSSTQNKKSTSLKEDAFGSALFCMDTFLWVSYPVR